ncbi:MAG: PDZ domain-containing protein [Candidatus Thiodiazotropha sp. (ex Monitilora ramsayi)]|nr:PDZ domain-containing protein [Candidatus Thiodiazotropha sp. (ex Monitilora ramsayi)]
MTRQLGGRKASDRAGNSRKVSLGAILDFTCQGEGYRLDGVKPGSPAEQAYLGKMDIITGIDDMSVKELRDISNILKKTETGTDDLYRLSAEWASTPGLCRVEK